MEIKLCRYYVIVFAFLFCGQLISKNNFGALAAGAFIYYYCNVDFIHANVVHAYRMDFDVTGSHLSFRVVL